MTLDAHQTKITRRVKDAYTGKVREVTIDLGYKIVRLHDDVEESDYLLGVKPEDLETIKAKVEAFFDDELAKKIDKTSITDNLTTTDATMVLSARQGSVIKTLIEDLGRIVASDDINLDELQEVVTYIKANRDTLSTLSVENIAGLPQALDEKADAGTVATLSSELAQLKETVRFLQERVDDEHGEIMDTVITTTDLSGFKSGPRPLSEAIGE